jgi:hypothetical protein
MPKACATLKRGGVALGWLLFFAGYGQNEAAFHKNRRLILGRFCVIIFHAKQDGGEPDTAFSS